MIKFKFKYLEQEFKKLDTRLQVFLLALNGFCIGHFGKPLLITCLFRDDDGTHGQWCGGDFRIHQKNVAVPYFTPDQVKKIEVFCGMFIYDKTRLFRKVLFIHRNRINGIYSDDPKDGIHGHAQVCPWNNELIIRKS